jgi:hypothetical protein
MSTALGIASVTHVLKDLLNDGLINNDVATAVGDVHISTIPPGLVEASSGTTQTQLNLFMYRVSHNLGWNNIAYPSRNASGDLTANPPLALNLHYLLTAFGDSELHAEILLGYGMQLLHEHPVLEREVIRHSLTLATPGNEGTLPENLRQLATSELADQIELIKLTPEPINMEEISKLWTAFHTKYRPCTAYLATVVLIESNRSTLSPLPVQERKFYTILFKQPVIEKLLSQVAVDDPILENQRILVGHRLVIRGKQLKSDVLSVLINGESFIPMADDISDTQVGLELPNTLQAGVQGVQIVQPVMMGTPPEPRRGVESNLHAFVLSPSITDYELSDTIINGDELISADLMVQVIPEIHQRQRVVLLLNELLPGGSTEKPKSYSFLLSASVLALEEDPVDTVTFRITNMRTGDYLIRIQVDGAESPLYTNNDGEYNEPQIDIS